MDDPQISNAGKHVAPTSSHVESAQDGASSDVMPGSLVETGWLFDHLDDDNLRIVDMRGAVKTRLVEPGVQSAEYQGAIEAYREGHIPGAVYIDWTRDIIDPNDPVPAQVAPPEHFARTMEEHGIGDYNLVVAYDDHPSSQFATRMWWALRYYGHEQVGILNGGWKQWTGEGRPVSREIPAPIEAHFTPRIQPGWRTTAEDLLRTLGTGETLLVDARDGAQFSGAIRRGPRGGHIPGAIHLPREALFAPDGTVLPADRLEEAVRAAGLNRQQPVIAYCNGGVAATSVLFALDRLGFHRLSNYDGSWNEWGRRADLPVET